MTSPTVFDAMTAQLSPMVKVHVRAAGPELPDVLDPDSVTALPGGPHDAVFVITEGCSASAAQARAVAVVMAVTARLLDWDIGPVVLAERAAIDLGDEIGALMNAAMVVVLTGERSDLAATESLSAYVTYAPQVGRHDVERHCVADIGQGAEAYGEAAEKLVMLMARARPAARVGREDDDPTDTLDPDSIDKLLDSKPSNLRSSKPR